MSEELLNNRKRDIRLKLLRTVGFWDKGNNPIGHQFFPPLAMGIIFSQLKQNGYNISQDDLNIRAHYDNYNKAINKQYEFGLFFQEDRIKQYVKSGTDGELEDEIEKMIADININDIDIFLLSIPESIYNSSNILFTIAFARYLKKKSSSQIIVGGHSPSVMLLITQYDVNGIIDYIVAEDGEEAVIDVMERIIYDKDNEKFNEVKAVRKPSKKIVVPDFSGLPFEKYRLSFLDYKDFFSNEILRDFFVSDILILPFQFIKGYPNACAFCASSGEGLKSFLAPEEVVDSIKILQEKFNPAGYLFLNDTINISKRYIEKICEMIAEKDIHILWSDCARVNGLDEEIIAKLHKSGCIRLILGMETASPSLLKRVNKGITLAELENVLMLATKYGIWTGVEVICGLPYETDEDINMTIDFLRNNKKYIDRIYCNIFDLREYSLMCLHPENYGIENIHGINLYAEKSDSEFNICNFVRYRFDECNGLKWEDKKKQMIDSYKRVISATDAGINIPHFLEEHFLFYLYSRFDNKDRIKKHYLEINDIFHQLYDRRTPSA